MNKFLSNLKQTPGFYTFWYFLILQGMQQTWAQMPAEKKALLFAALPTLKLVLDIVDPLWWYFSTLATFVILRAYPQSTTTPTTEVKQ